MILLASSVATWTTLDLKFAYNINKSIEIGVFSNNRLNSTTYLVKNNASPFDYQNPKRANFRINNQM